ncbi:hypothetical protein [Actinoallomurus sp. CA-142502]|uniref:hypothetical protein n=1 Tax=Actinoallomurus sp. CA-142502 TaxID=3239885 RepID=UPI003D8AD411
MIEMAELRQRLHKALTQEHYRRAHERIEASPEEHCAAFTDVAMAIFGDVVLNQTEERRT